MENFDDSDFKLPRAKMTGNVYEGVKKRVIATKRRAAKNRRQIAIGSVLLLVFTLVNGFLLFGGKEPPRPSAKNDAEMVYQIFFRQN